LTGATAVSEVGAALRAAALVDSAGVDFVGTVFTLVAAVALGVLDATAPLEGAADAAAFNG
jgi:hypothetical protein